MFFRMFFCVWIVFSNPIFSQECSLEEIKKNYAEQKQEVAIQAFLHLLQSTKKTSDPYQAKEEEQTFYGEALKIYFQAKGPYLQAGSQEILKRFVPVLDRHPDYSNLAFIIAAAHANRNNFIKCLDVFYPAYLQHPDHFLAYKIQAILGIKLFEKELPGENKEAFRTHIEKHLALAVKFYPQDTSLYRLKILYASQLEKPMVVLECLNKIISEDIVIPRAELGFYLNEALSLKDRQFALRFIDKASSWYRFSRLVTAAREQLLIDFFQNSL